MGKNRRLPSPDAYPAVFLSVTRNGGGVVYAKDTPWSPGSVVKRFRLFLAVLRAHPSHPLYERSLVQWHATATHRAVAFSMGPATPPVATLSAPLIALALSREG